MKAKVLFGLTVIFAASCFMCGQGPSQGLDQVDQQWHKTVDALERGDRARANADFNQFNAIARSYAAANGKNWQIEYLVGSLDCLFPATKSIGAEFLEDILENNRTLNDDGEAELHRQLNACTAHGADTITLSSLTAPQNLAEASTHYEIPGVRGNMKGGARIGPAQEASAAVSPIAAKELLSRRVTVLDPPLALRQALARMPAGSRGALVGQFAVTTVQGTQADAEETGKCLQSYAAPLSAEFQIDSSAYIVTAYTVPDEDQVYDFARKLHGLNLPIGVIAYSVPEDMSLVSDASGGSCGSMAHELVHLLIKQRFSGAPAWLEEGLASEVAIARPTPNTLRFDWSWRDDTLVSDIAERPSVAQLLEAPWSDYTSDSMAGTRRAEALQAMAAVFIRYLDAKGKLREVYFSVRDQHLSRDLSGFKSYREIVEEKLEENVVAVDADFSRWFAAQEAEERVSMDTQVKGAPANSQAGPPACDYSPNAPAQVGPCVSPIPVSPAANAPPPQPKK